MTAGKQGDEELVDHVVLPDDHPADLGPDVPIGGPDPLDRAVGVVFEAAAGRGG